MNQAKNSPQLSVLMTSYNREQFITEAIESILASSFNDFELLIVDDNSRDNTISIARSYEKNDTRIRVYVNEINLGDYPNRNCAASYAIGEFIMYVDSDDKILPNGFEQCIKAMKDFPGASFGMYFKGKMEAPLFIEPEIAIRRHFFKEPFLMMGPGGTIIRRSFFEDLGGYPEKYGPANDMYFNLKAASLAGVVLLPFEFNFYRIHEGQEINNKYSYLFNNYRYLRDALEELNLPLNENEKDWISNKNKRRFLVNLTSYLAKTGDIKGTFEAGKKAGFGIRDTFKAIVH